MRTKLFKTTFTAALALAVVLTFGCDGGGGGKESDGGKSSTGSANKSVTYQGEIYQTVVIGTQTWFARNLNYDASGSKCYDNDPANCAKYGRLYDRATAMTICPSGWHLPSKEEWEDLAKYVKDEMHLRAKSGWNGSGRWEYGNGDDMYGFTALPGGNGSLKDDGDIFSDVGDDGWWWSSSERSYGTEIGFYRIYMTKTSTSSSWDISYGNNTLASVRCVKDVVGGNSSSSLMQSSSSLTRSSSSANASSSSSAQCNEASNGTFTDTRDGKEYKYVAICNQVWIAENLNYETEGSKCYGEDGIVIDIDDDDNRTTLSSAEVQENCNKYGRLYDWSTAMGLPSECNKESCSSQITENHQGVCPSGWHIPNDQEWRTLATFVGGTGTNNAKNAGTYLKAISGWNNDGNGIDTYGFTALPGGNGGYNNSFTGAGDIGVWWSSSISIVFNLGRLRFMGSGTNDALLQDLEKIRLLSVRCIKD